MIKSPNSKSCGKIPITNRMEINVPLPKHTPMPEIAPSEERNPMAVPAAAKILPEVKIVGNANSNDCFIASIFGIFCRSSI